MSMNMESLKDFAREIAIITEEVQDLLVQKRHDYGPGNIPKFGEKGVVVRLFDKAERLANLVWEDKAPNFEAVEDTWKDVIGYGILGLLEHRKHRA